MTGQGSHGEEGNGTGNKGKVRIPWSVHQSILIHAHSQKRSCSISKLAPQTLLSQPLPPPPPPPASLTHRSVMFISLVVKLSHTGRCKHLSEPSQGSHHGAPDVCHLLPRCSAGSQPKDDVMSHGPSSVGLAVRKMNTLSALGSAFIYTTPTVECHPWDKPMQLGRNHPCGALPVPNPPICG